MFAAAGEHAGVECVSLVSIILAFAEERIVIIICLRLRQGQLRQKVVNPGSINELLNSLVLDCDFLVDLHLLDGDGLLLLIQTVLPLFGIFALLDCF